jgi:hypothetical protein
VRLGASPIGSPREHGQGQRYTDAVVDNATAYAGAALKRDVAAVRKAIEEGASFADIRAAVLATYRAMPDNEDLADIFAATHVLTHAAGATEAHVETKGKSK